MTKYEWLTILALGLSLTWPIYQLISCLKGSKLKLTLATDLFMRLLPDYGETFFIKPILLSENGNILIKNVEGNLNLIDPTSKKWSIEFKLFGELVHNPNNILSDHHFHSSSPLQYLVSNKPLRGVYLGVIDIYSQKFTTEIKALDTNVANIKKDIPINLQTLESIHFPTLTNEEAQCIRESTNKINKLCDRYTKTLSDCLQIEPGEYKFTLKISYKTTNSIIFWKRSCKSTIYFTIENSIKSLLSNQIPKLLQSYTLASAHGSKSKIIYPKYNPIDIKTA